MSTSITTRSTVVVSLLVLAAADAGTITLNPAIRHQTIEGFGTFLGATDAPTRAAWSDLGLNIMRMNIDKSVLTASANDWATRVPLGTNVATNVAKMNFGVSQVADFGATAQYLAANTLEPARFKLIADSWSPPHWMKGPTGASQQWVGNPGFDSPAFATPWLSNTYNHWFNGGPPGNPHFLSQTGDSVGGRLRTEDPTNLAEYGRYMAAYVKGFQQTYKVPIANISLQNESSFENPFDSMSMVSNATGGSDYTQFAKALKSTRDAFAAAGLTTGIRGPHVANVGPTPQSPWGLLQQMGMIDAVRNDADPTLLNSLTAYTSNYYMGIDQDSVKATAGYWKGKDAVPANWAGWTNASGIAQDGKQNWYVETGDGDGRWLNGANNTPGDGALTVALKIHNALVHSDASAYLYWSFVDGADVTQYGLLGTNDLANPAGSKKYNAFKQFSRFVRPGAVRIDAKFANGTSSDLGQNVYDTLNSVDVSAYLHEQDRTLTLVILNITGSAVPETIAVPAGLGVTSFDLYRTTGTDNFASLIPLTVINGQVTLSLPAYSVVTLVGRTNAVPEPAAAGLLLPLGLLARRRR